MNTGQISDPSVIIKPSKKLFDYIKTIKISDDLPAGIGNIVFKNKVTKKPLEKPTEVKYLTTGTDRDLIKQLKLNNIKSGSKSNLGEDNASSKMETEKTLTLQEIQWLFEYINAENRRESMNTYFHELFDGSEIVLPKNKEIPRSEALEKRCQELRAKQENAQYYNMTKNVDNIRKRHPEDTIAFQMKQMNRQLIAVFQFVMSVLAGFAFGFIGVELIIGNLDFGFRLLLGIICALTIALADLYFLAKRLNEDLKFETAVERKKTSTKLD